jgi:hypothetical protein
MRCFFVSSCEMSAQIRQVTVPEYDDLPSIRDGSEAVDGLMYAVCTHGRHDKCCAKFGIPVYCALRDEVGERAWECSHVGGDRFAANLVVFPYGLYYGHVSPDDVAAVVRCSEAGEIWLKGYRGRSCFRRDVQVAEYFARVESGRLAIDEFTPLESLRTGEGETQVRFESRSDRSIHVVKFATRTDKLRELLTCGSTEPSVVPQYELIEYSVGL